MKSYQYSKKIPIITGILFVFVLLCSILPFFCVDSTIWISLISATGGVFTSAIIWYMKKAQIENAYKLKMGLYEKASEVRLKFLRESLKIQKKYGVTQTELNEIEFNNPIDDFEDAALSDLQQTVDTHFQEGEQTIDLQQ